MIRGGRFLLALAASAVSGCSTFETSLSTRPSFERSEQQSALPGISYSLPMLQYQVDVAYKLTNCDGGTDQNGKLNELTFSVEPVATAEHPAGESYTIDYRALSSPLKITDFSIEEHEKTRTLKAINAAADDRSLDVIKSVAEVGVAVASLATGNPAGLTALALTQGDGGARAEALKAIVARSRMTVPACSSDARLALAARTAAQSAVEARTKELAQATEKMDAITARARLRMASARDRARLVKLQEEQIVAARSLAAEQEKLKKADKALSFLDTVNWPLEPTTVEGRLGWTGGVTEWVDKLVILTPTEALDPDAIRSERAALSSGGAPGFTALSVDDRTSLATDLETALVLQRNDDRTRLCGAKATKLECLAPQLGVHASLVRESPLPTEACGVTRDAIARPCLVQAKSAQSNGGRWTAHAVKSNAPHKGVFIRQPVRARLLLCDKNEPCHGQRKPLLQSKWDTAPQLGQLRFVELQNGVFQNNALSIALREDGSIVKFQYAEKAAIAAAAAAAAANVATKANDFSEKREKERKQAVADARAEIAYARAETAYTRTEAAAIRTEAAAVRNDEVAQIQYEIDKLTKQKALLELRFPTAPEDPVVAREFTNETIRIQAVVTQLQARLAQLNAEQAIEQASRST